MTTLTIDAVNFLPYVRAGSMTVKRNTFDVALVNPVSIPALGDAVELTDPTWSGTVASVTTADLTEKRGNAYLVVTISATNNDVAGASVAPFNLSDVPNNTTTFGYRDLQIRRAANTDGSTVINGSCLVYREGLWPGMTFEITSANQGLTAEDFTVTDVTVTWQANDVPVYTIAFGDPIVTMSVWLNNAASDFILPIDATKITDGAVTTPKLAANAVTADKIDAQSITADKLAAELILASQIKTAASGKRVEIDGSGIRNYGNSGELLVNIPTTGSDPVSVTGQVEASSLVSTSSAEFRGTNTLAAGSVTTVEGTISNPSSAPTVVSTLDSLTLTTTPTYIGHGLCYDSAGDSGGATATYWIGADPSASGSNHVAYEYNAATGVLLRTITTTGSTSTTTKTLGATTHISDTTQAYSGTSNSQVATPLTMTEAGTITKVSAFMAGYLGTCSARVALWNTSGTILASSSSFTAASRTFSNGNDLQYNQSLSTPYVASNGETVWAGFLRNSGSEGFFYSRDDGSGKTTKRGDNLSGSMTGIETDSASKPNIYITYTVTTDTRLEGDIGKIIGVARQGTYIWVLDVNGWLYRYSQSTLAFVDKFDLSSYVAGTKANAGLFWDGTNIIITTATGTTGTDQVRFIKVTTAGAYSSTLSATGLAINGSSTTIRGGYSDGTNYWVAVGVSAYAFNKTTGANVANRDFGTSTEVGSGVTYDGTVFRAYSSASSPTKVWKYTTWDWTTESSLYWVGYSWYDSNATGGTHETTLSPRASISLGRRRRLSITNPAIPTGGSDDPDKVRVYMQRSASQPALGSYALQVTDALTTRTFSTFASGGAADSTSNTFGTGIAGEFRSAISGWSLKGDGTATFGGTTGNAIAIGNDGMIFDADIANTVGIKGQQDATAGAIVLGSGKDTNLYRSAANVLKTDDSFSIGTGGFLKAGNTSFPAGPTTNDLFYRTDYGMWFYYDGTRWLCTCAHEIQIIPDPTVTWPFAATATRGLRVGIPVGLGTDLYLTRLDVDFFVNGGTALSGSHQWVGTLDKAVTGNTTTTIRTVTINSGTSTVWRVDDGTINALLNNGTSHFELSMTWTKTGTPGNLFVYARLGYRHVAT